MSNPKRRSLRKSDIGYAAAFGAVLYLVICYGIAIGNYDLDCHVRQEIRVAGTVSTEDESLPDFTSTYRGSDGSSGSFVGLYPCTPGCCNEDEEEANPSTLEYDTLIPTGWCYASRHGNNWTQQSDHPAKLAIRLSLDLPDGWHTQPPDYFIEGPCADINFLVSRDTP